MKENIVTTLGCKAQIYMWKKEAGNTDVFVVFVVVVVLFFSACSSV